MGRLAAAARTDAPDIDLVSRVADLEGRVRCLEEARRAPLTPTDRQLLAAIVEHIGAGCAFSASELLRHGNVDDALAAALSGSQLTDAISIGRRLRRIARHGVGLSAIGRDTSGTIWILQNDDVTTSSSQS